MIVLEDKNRFNTVNINLGIELGFGYSITKKHRLILSFNYNKALSDLYHDNYITQKTTYLGSKIGFYMVF